LQAEPNRNDSAWKTNLRYEMEAFTLYAEPSLAERVHWLMLVLLASRRPILLRDKSNFLESSTFFLYNECKYTALRSFDKCGAFKTGFVGTK
jgi:hypothetical protein